MSTFGNELRAIRRNAKLTLLDLAKVAGLSVAYVSQIERGERNPPNNTVIVIWLRLMKCSHRLDEFIELAKSSQTRVSVPLDNTRSKANSVLTALARSYEENNLGEDVWTEIRTILERPGIKYVES
jgi:transcriptional regulator with XRE-family HTH domain